MHIKTDHKWKQFKYRNEVPASVLKSQFDYQDPDDAIDNFFKYRGYWYHLDGFMATNSPNSPLATLGYNGYASDSYFSGILIKLSPDCETYQVATYIS